MSDFRLAGINDFKGLKFAANASLIYSHAMPMTLASLLEETEVYTVEAYETGFVLARRPGADGAFDAVARQVINHSSESFAAFPRADGRGGYDSVLIIPTAGAKA